MRRYAAMATVIPLKAVKYALKTVLEPVLLQQLSVAMDDVIQMTVKRAIIALMTAVIVPLNQLFVAMVYVIMMNPARLALWIVLVDALLQLALRITLWMHMVIVSQNHRIALI
jgi:hypothetical protein